MPLVQYSFATPTSPPLGLYAPLSATDGLTAPDSGLLTAFGRVLQCILELTTTASTLGFKWLSLGTFSRRRLTLPATPASGYYLEPTTTCIASGNSSPAILAIPPLIIIISVLFGAVVVYFGRRCTPVYKAQTEKLSPKSMYSESPTLFCQDDSGFPPASHMPRFSFLWVSALSFILRGLAYLFRLIHMEKLLDMVEDNTTPQKVATSAISHIAELRTLDKKLVQAMNVASPTPARLPDANETLAASLSPEHATSKLGQLVSAADETVEIIPLPQACPPLCTDVAPTVTRIAPPATEISDPFAIRNAGSTFFRQGGEGTGSSLPASNRSSLIPRHSTSTTTAPFPVEPSGVPDGPLATSSPLSKSSYKFSKPNFLSSDKVDIIPLPKDIMACPPTCTDISPASTRKASVAPVSEKIANPLAIGTASATSDALRQGGKGTKPSFPTSYRGSPSTRRPTSPPDTAAAPFSVEPSGVPEEPSAATSSPLSKPSYKFRPIHLTAGDCPSTPPHNNASVSPSQSVEPAGVPDRVAAPLGPRTESDYQTELRRIFERCMEDSPRQPRVPKPAALDFDTAPRPRSGYVCQAELQRIFQPCFDDPRLQPKSPKPVALTSSVRPLDPSLEIITGHRRRVPASPKTPPRRDITAIHRTPKDSRDRLASTRSSTGTEGAIRPFTSTSQKNTTTTHHSLTGVRLQLTRERPGREGSTSTGSSATNLPRPLVSTSQESTASTRSSIGEEANRTSRSHKDIAPTDRGSKDPSTEAGAGSPLTSTPLRRTPKVQASPSKIVPKGTNGTETIPNLLESVEAVRERARRAIERAREAANSTDARIRAKYPARESQTGEQPRRPKPVSTDTDAQAVAREETPRDKARNILEQIRQDHKDLFARVHATLKYHDEKRELRAKSMASREADKTRERPVSKLPSKYRRLAKPQESQEVATTTGPSEGSQIERKGEPGESDQVARLHALLELDVPVPDDRRETNSAENEATSIEQTSWSLEGYVRPTDDEPCGGSTSEDLEESNASPVESSWQVEDHIPAATDDDTWYDEELDDLDLENGASSSKDHQAPTISTIPIRRPRSQPRSFSAHAHLDQPQKIHDLFYSPTFAPSTPNKRSAPNTHFLKGEVKMTGFGFGSPCSRRIQQLDPRDTFETSTPRVNHAHFGGFCTSTPRRGVDNRRDSWADFF